MSDPAPSPLLLRKYLLLATAARRPTMTAAALAVLAVLLERFNVQEQAAWPSLNTLADDTGRDRKTVQRALALLISEGFIEVGERGDRRHRSNRYRLRLELGAPMPLANQRTRGAHAPRSRGADAPSARGADAPRTHSREQRSLEGGSDTAQPRRGAGAPAAAPVGVDAGEWAKLLDKRPDLDEAELREAIELHRGRGCPAAALNEAMAALRLTKHHKSLSLSYRPTRVNGSNGSNGSSGTKKNTASKPASTRAPRRRPPASAASGFDQKNYSDGLPERTD